MRKIIHNLKELDDQPIDINQVNLDFVHVIAINKFASHIKGVVINLRDGEKGLMFPFKSAVYNSATEIKEKDLPSLIKRLKNDYDFYVL